MSTEGSHSAPQTPVNCHWIAANLEAYFSDGLPRQERRAAESHMESCASCRTETQSLQSIDPLMKDLLQYRLSVASAGPARVSWRLRPSAVVAAALLCATVLTVVALRPAVTQPPVPARIAVVNPPTEVGQPIPDKGAPPAANRVKPGETPKL